MEKDILQEDAQIIVIILIAILVLLVMAGALILFFFFSRKKISNAELEKATLALAYQKELLHTTIETQEKERKRIAQDLHDAISSKLNVVSLSTNVLIDGQIEQEEEKETLHRILDITTNTLESSRRLAHNLLPPILENFGLQAAIEELCDEFSSSKKVTVSYDISYQDSLSKNDELHLFRILQELLNNSVRHGKASSVDLTITDTDVLSLHYVDNGTGFDINLVGKNKGIGLKNIESRVEILEGSIDYHSTPGQGAEFNISITHS
ncbi:sensor histidine kinase [Aquimarina brevivitae]|uniref:Oxygen sensor histidine kinase NreB n=1 Tax=Aquimarina brevivitae TaxID=323412 RepID=A0A4Q7NU95_9FLAO|nr:ATP-binding protein [Aquimarina brevivitae]RZS90756.1 histidine kinase/DNA gyrase B/HSP90-like ATPase [Aquimarina brevivitae]